MNKTARNKGYTFFHKLNNNAIKFLSTAKFLNFNVAKTNQINELQVLLSFRQI